MWLFIGSKLASPALKIEAAGSFIKLVPIYPATRRTVQKLLLVLIALKHSNILLNCNLASHDWFSVNAEVKVMCRINKGRHRALTLILLAWRIWWAPNNANNWQMRFNWAFKGVKLCVCTATDDGPVVTLQWTQPFIITIYSLFI